MNEVVKQPSGTAVRASGQFDLSPQTFEQAMTFSKMLANSDMVPKDFKGKPENCLIAIQWGSELGLKPLQSLQNLAVINGRPALWGDAVLALVLASPVCEYVVEDDDGKTATCRVKRKGAPEQSRTFSIDDAVKAGLAGKQGPWTQYPKRMRQMRARAFALRDVFTDVLRGIPIAEELQDTEDHQHSVPVEKPMGPVEVVLPVYEQSKFSHNVKKWAQTVADGAKKIDDVLAWLQSKNTITAEQEQQLRDEVAKLQQPADDQAPKVDPEKLAADMNACTDIDALYELGGLIDAVTDENQAEALSNLFDARVAELEQA